MKIYIDFDRTLFDCESYLNDFYTIIKEYKIPKNVFIKYQNQCKRNGFNPDLILKGIFEEYKFDISIYEKINDLLNNSKKYLYNDAIGFLKYLKTLNYQVIILTKGNYDYQKEKINNSKINEFYNDLIIAMQHKGNLDIDYKESIFIDDNPIEIKSILKRKPKKVIRIKRKNSKYFDVKINNIETVLSLNEIINNKLL